MGGSSLVEALDRTFEEVRGMDGPLNQRLQIMADTVRSLSIPFAEAVERVITRLRESGAGVSAPDIGDLLPPFLLPDETGRLVSLRELLQAGPVAIAFHRGYWCPYCQLNTLALAQVQGEIAADGAQIVAITPDRAKFNADFKEDSGARFPILTDMDNGYALSLNLVIWVGEEMARMIAAAGWDVPRRQGNPSWTLPIPATFVVGKDGIVTARFLDPDYRKRMEIEDLLRAIRNAR